MSDRDITGQAFEYIIVGNDFCWTLQTVQYVAEVSQFGSEDLPDGLFTQADPQYRFFPGIHTDDVKQQSGFFRNTRTGGKQDLVESSEFFQPELVVA